MTVLESSLNVVTTIDRAFMVGFKGEVDLLKLYNTLQTEHLRTYIEACRIIRNARRNE